VTRLAGKVAVITGADLPVDGGLTAHGGAKPLSDAVRP
jgi:3alpha(or 20beta)-hydroxysteroid dehydrogenase